MKKKILIIIAVIVVVLAAAIMIYIKDYYHADSAAQQCITEPAGGVEVTEIDKDIYAFVPTSFEPEEGIIFYPGGKVEAESYAPLMSELAERGIVSILVSMPANLAVLDVDAAQGLQEEFPEIEDWYMAGHSLGGSMAASYLGDAEDDFEGLILLASYSTEDLSNTDLKVLSIYGSEDGVLDMEKYEENKVNLPDYFEEHVIEGGCHAYFGAYGMQDGDGQPTITQEEQLSITADLIAIFAMGLSV